MADELIIEVNNRTVRNDFTDKIFGLGRIILSAALFWNISQNAVAADMSALNFNGDLNAQISSSGFERLHPIHIRKPDF